MKGRHLRNIAVNFAAELVTGHALTELHANSVTVAHQAAARVLTTSAAHVKRDARILGVTARGDISEGSKALVPVFSQQQGASIITTKSFQGVGSPVSSTKHAGK